MTSLQVDQQTTYGITRARRAAHGIEFYFRIKDEWWMPFETILKHLQNLVKMDFTKRTRNDTTFLDNSV